MANRVGKYKLSKRDSAVSLADGGTINGTLKAGGDAQLQVVNPVSGSATTITVSKATHSGRTTAIPRTLGAVTHTIPAPEAGVHYHFVYVGYAAAGHNVAFDITENGVFEGGVTWLHEGDTDSVDAVHCDPANNDLLTAVTPQAFDIHMVGKDSSNYYVWGNIVSATVPTCANG